ncbi:zinc finger ccch domain-containing protein 44 [Fagus crenata]
MKKENKLKKDHQERDSEAGALNAKMVERLLICDYGHFGHFIVVGLENVMLCLCSFALHVLQFLFCSVLLLMYWHSCLVCQKTAKFHCFCCPNAICGCCINAVEFAPVRGKKGFCNNCLKLVLLVEQNVDYDSDGEDKGLTVDNVYSADAQLKKSENLKCCSNSVRIGKAKDDIEYQKAMGKRKEPKALEFIGWGSKPLITFLTSIGKDTTRQLSEYDVESIISGYIQEKNLFHPEKKKKVLCDELLYSLFRKKSVDKNKIYTLLEVHFAVNLEQSEEDEIILGEKNNENIIVACKKQKTLSSSRTYQEKEVNLTVKQSWSAAIVAENIKLVYLRKSLVERLLKQPESFECRVVGSFVRVKTDPRDYQQRSSHQLLQVRGIKKTSSEILLQVSSMPIDLHIAMLSDGDFTEVRTVWK